MRLASVGAHASGALPAAKAQASGSAIRLLVETAAVLGRAAVQANADAFAAVRGADDRDIQSTGVTSYDGIAAALNARGVRTRRKGEWHASTVRNLLLRRPRLALS